MKTILYKEEEETGYKVKKKYRYFQYRHQSPVIPGYLILALTTV